MPHRVINQIVDFARPVAPLAPLAPVALLFAAAASVATALAARTGLDLRTVHTSDSSNPATATSPVDGNPASRRSSELSRRLLDRRQSDDPMDRMLAKMDDSAVRLSTKHDAGAETQRAQAAALAAIDEAIAEAKKNQPRSSQAGKATQGEARRAGQRGQPPREPSKSQGRKPTTSDGGKGAGTTAGAESKRKPLSQQAELRRGWGFLPQRDRDAIIQGAGETFPERYRNDIERYYRALAETAERRDSRRGGESPRKAASQKSAPDN